MSNIDGHWQQHLPKLELKAGRNDLDIEIDGTSWMQASGQSMPWTATHLSESVRGGVIFLVRTKK